MLSSGKIIIFLIYLAIYGEAINFPVRKREWAFYKKYHQKEYRTAELTEIMAQFNYLASLNTVFDHNRRDRTYRLRMNQYSDMKQQDINVLFPPTKQPKKSFDSYKPWVSSPPQSYNPMRDRGLQMTSQHQGMACNSGWAYATAKAVEVFRALRKADRNPAPLSAQNLIDCAVRQDSCKSQVPQDAFDYLAVRGQELHLMSDYPNQESEYESGMCQRHGSRQIKMRKYGRIADGDDAALMKYVGAGYPVVVEFNPTSFDFIHYGAGVFQPPTIYTWGSHFMTVIGYGHDNEVNLDYWLVQNSFGEFWGEHGRIRIMRNASNPLAKSAIFPTDLN